MQARSNQNEPANSNHAASVATSANTDKPVLKDELKDLITDVEELIVQTASLSGDELKLARARIAERLDSAKETLKGMGSSAAKQAKMAVKATDKYVHEQPWKAVAVGATVGLLLGVILARR